MWSSGDSREGWRNGKVGMVGIMVEDELDGGGSGQGGLGIEW